jgi:hypothetical protein
MERPKSFQSFWPGYLRAHRNPDCRRMHYIGSTGALVGMLLATVRLNPLWFAGGMVFAYGMAWIGHFAVERNRPATFGNPLWSLIGDIRMYLLWLTGRLGPELLAAEGGATGETNTD